MAHHPRFHALGQRIAQSTLDTALVGIQQPDAVLESPGRDKAMGDNGRDQRLIQTVHGRGYRFVGTVTEVDDGGPSHPGPHDPLDVATPPADTGPSTDAAGVVTSHNRTVI